MLSRVWLRNIVNALINFNLNNYILSLNQARSAASYVLVPLSAQRPRYYTTGLGPLACSSLVGGYQLDIDHLMILLLADRGTASAEVQGSVDPLRHDGC